MNYLAHLYLAEQSREGLLGSLLGDFVKGRPDGCLPEAVRRGIVLHRAIDRFTDAHPRHRASRNRVSKPRRRYAGIIVDVCYDHFLARHWSDYADEPLDAFTAHVYDVLRAHGEDLPDRLRRILPRMIADDWLGSYADLDNVGRALDGIARRITRRNTLAGAIVEIESAYAGLESDFREFFPELQARARQLRSELVARPGTV